MPAKLMRVAEAICRGLAAFGLIALIGLAGLTVLSGLGRSMFSAPIEFVNDAGSLVAATAVASCFPMALLHKSNISIDLLSLVLPRWAARPVGLSADLLVLVVAAAMARQVFVYAAKQLRAGDSSAMLEIPTAPFWFYVGLMLAIAAAIQLFVVANNLVGWYGRTPEIRPPQTD